MTGRRLRGCGRWAATLTVLALLLICTPWQSAMAHADEHPPFLQVLIDDVTPQTVTTADPMVTVHGTVRNVGDRSVSDVVVRLERADAAASDSELRTTLRGHHDQYRPVGEFITVADTLTKGQQRQFTLAFPLRAAHGGTSWDITAPGVYPALVNVNGTPEYGSAARLDDAHFLLPVLGVPPAGSTPGTEVAPDISHPVGLTMLWPLADRPRLVGGQPGGTGPARLIDDQLAQSLSPGGRLDVLLGAVDFATSPAVDPQGDLGRSVCLAVDADLLVTVNDMALGYQVLDDPAAPSGPTHPGTGQPVAAAWLDRLRAIGKHTCVTALPYAQADLDAVARIADVGLSDIATSGAADIVDQILGVTSLRGATLLPNSPLTGPAVDMLTAQGPTVAVAPLRTSGETSASLRPQRVSPAVVSAPFNPAIGAALSATGATPTSPDYVPPALQLEPHPDSRAARLQDALGAMVWPSLQSRRTPRDQVLLPSSTWDLSESEARAILSTAATLLHSGLATPRPLSALIGQSRAATQSTPVDVAFGADSPDPVGDAECAGLGDQVRRLWGLTAALTVDPRTGMTGTQYTAPLREDSLRAVSTSVPAAQRDDLARSRLEAIWRAVTDMFNAVTVVNPGASYTLATEHSPLPLVLRNELPVPIRVRLQVEAPAGMRADDVGVQEVPPGYLPVKVPMEVNVTQRVAVDVSLRTADGMPLGEPVRLSVHSNAYGKLLFIMTISAASVLFALTARRLWHRFRGQPDRADLDRGGERWEP